MKRTILTAALAACALSATAQIMEERNPVPMTPGGGRVYRTEVVPYDARHDAEARNREAGGYWKAFEPEVTIATEGPLHAVLEQEIEILVDLKSGDEGATAWGCDLTYDYVKINGDYRT